MPLAAGDIALISFNADANASSQKTFQFVVLTAVAEGTVIYFTDNGWTAAGAFRTGEGVMTYTVPPGGIPAGTVITIVGSGNFNASATGDAILAYTGSAASPVFLFGVDFADGNTTWAADATNSNTSAVPTGLTVGTTALAFNLDNGVYTGPTSGTQAELQAAIANPANWTLNDSTSQTTAVTQFSVTGDGGPEQTSVTINNVSVTEGDDGTVEMTFTVTRSDADGDFTVDFTTANGTATTADGDYVATSGQLHFEAGGALTQTITVTVNGDTVAEANQTLSVVLSNLQNNAGEAAITDNTGVGTIVNDDLIAIYDIQGAGHTSAYAGQQVLTTGIVTAIDKDNNAYWIQDPDGDGDTSTSDGIYVYVGSALSPDIVVGALVRVSGTVQEYQASAPYDLTLTEITGSVVTQVLSVDNDLPDAVVIGATNDWANGFRTPPTTDIGDDETTGTYSPTTDGIDFWESLEGMRVTLNDVRLVSPHESDYGELIGTPNIGENDSANGRGGLTISDETPDTWNPADKEFDFNPERIQIDDEAGIATPTPTAVGDSLGDLTGVISYGQGFYEINPTEAYTLTPSAIERETTTIEENLDRIRIATFNVENLSPVGTNGGGSQTTQAKFDALADAIINNLGAPEIIGLQELQDNNGSFNDAIVDASITVQQLIDAIVARGGPQYHAILSDPVDGAEGGEGGGNIQVAYLYLPDAVEPTDGNNLSGEPGDIIRKLATGDRIGMGDTDFAATRKSLPIEWSPAGYSEDQGGTFYTINNHFSSKGGSGPLLGNNLNQELWTDPFNSDSVKREGQAEAVHDFIEAILSDGLTYNDKIIALGDFNDFQFFPVVQLITGAIERITAGSGNTPSTFQEGVALLKAMIETLPEEERYSYNFDGNAQALDQIRVTLDLVAGAVYDVVHMNSEFANQLSDHDPSIVSLLMPRSAGLATDFGDQLTQLAYTAHFGATRGSLAGDDVIYGLGGDDVIEGGAGADRIDGGDGVDTATYFNAAAGVTVSLAVITGYTGEAAGDRFYSIENLTGSAHDDSLTGNALANVLDGGAGADELAGGRGDDTYHVDDLGDVVTEGANAGRDLVIASVDYTLGANLENLTLTGSNDLQGIGNILANIIIGNAGDNEISGWGGLDDLRGGEGNDLLDGGDGNDLLDGGLGADDMFGGLGNDTYYVDDAGDTTDETAGGGIDTVFATASHVLGAGIERLIQLGTAAISAIGNTLGNILTGNSGTNELYGEEGKDTLEGGDGDDSLDGGDDSDKLFGGAGDDSLFAGAGADTLDGGDGADAMDGGEGNDTFYVDNVGDTIVEGAGGGADRAYTTVDFTLGAGVELETLYAVGPAGLTLTGNELGNRLYGADGGDILIGGLGIDRLEGGAGDDTLDGGEGNDTLDGGLGADDMSGGLGNDNYAVDDIGDTVTEAALGGTDTVKSAVDFVLGDNVENLTMTGADDLDGTGNALSNRIVGNAGDNVLLGLAGADTLDGGAGDDSLTGGVGADRMTGGDGADRFIIVTDQIRSSALRQTIETDTITDVDFSEGDIIDLSALDDLLFVGAFSQSAGEATLTYDSGTNVTTFRLDTDGDGKADYAIRLTGEVDDTVLTGGEPEGTGGWLI
jgi:predicted extracellular nuclease/Ca2+-binding RTX toxin-like protein